MAAAGAAAGASRAGPLCYQCQARKPRRSFSKSQLKKPAAATKTCSNCLAVGIGLWPRGASCWICLGDGERGRQLVSTGCGCRRGTGGFVHLDCVAANAAAVQQHKGTWGITDRESDVTPWDTCPTCKLDYTGMELQLHLARRWVARNKDKPELDPERLGAQHTLANALCTTGSAAEAEPIYRRLLAIDTERFGAGHRDTLVGAASLALALDATGKHALAEALYDATLETARRVFGPEHELTMMTAAHLCGNLHNQGKHTEVERLARAQLTAWRRLHGSDHEVTLRTATNLASALMALGKHAEAEALFRSALEVERRVYGPEHEVTLRTAESLAACLVLQGKHADAAPLLRESAGLGAPHDPRHRQCRPPPPTTSPVRHTHTSRSAPEVVD